MRFRNAFNILIYLSLAFLFIYLYRFDFFGFKKLEWKVFPLLASILLLWSGYLVSALSWQNILKRHNIAIGARDAIISHGLSVFAKYIPGKIWVILGRAGYISRFGFPMKTTSFLSMKEQLIYVWAGLLISAVPMVYFYGITLFSAFVLSLVLFFTFLLYSGGFHTFFIKVAIRITKKEWDIPFIRFYDSLNIIWFILGYWALWLVAFFLFVTAFYSGAGPEVAFAFPLSVTLGLLAIIFPGGLGVREGIMTGYLVLGGLPLEIATAISIYARLWFISGEIFIFMTGFICKWCKSSK
ncbi:MAG: flippase-like domain-containing protein [Bacteroidales bacterium]|nr:flippase-like domain-containing protein [Bacteroidales bacterium]